MKSKGTLLLYQVLAWLFMILLPTLTTFALSSNWSAGWRIFWTMLVIFKSYIILYFVNFYVFIPRLLSKRRVGWFIVANILLLPVVNIDMVYGLIYGVEFMRTFDFGEQADQVYVGYASGVFTTVLLNVFSILAAIGVRNVIQYSIMRRKLAEETSKRHEAELSMLKNQLNPHFLFNTLNNISSLVAFSPEKAQDSIAQLADLLRYNLYETESPEVSLNSEIDYMRNYISLMSLRYGHSNRIDVDMPHQEKDIKIAPMLFVSLIENAFKHGMVTGQPSFVKISLRVDDAKLVFETENSLYPKPDTDRSGSGIGLSNIERRLNLLYPDRHTYTVTQTDGVYKAVITIDLQ